jgi:phosphatidylserine/phosphatidylglycerophosphate/cardiolipin synthase-like enzyme
MPRVKVGPALQDGSTLDIEIARLRDLDVASLQARSHKVLRRRPSPHLPRHLLFRVLAYRLQADRLGDLDVESRRLLDGAGPPEDAAKRAVDRPTAELRPGTMLAREWNGRMHRVAVLADGFAWNGKTYPSLSKIARAITGTRWNGPRFFGLRDKRRKRDHEDGRI